MPQYILTLTHKAIIARDVFEFRFDRPAGFTFKAGQFLQFKIPLENGEVLRSYSIASAPDEDYIDFCIKFFSNGIASNFLAQLEIGSAMRVQGPEGRFVCEPDHAPRKVFIATGTGLAPLMSMIADQLANKTGESRWELWFGVRSEVDLFWQDRLAAFAQDGDFSFHTTLSQPNPSGVWTGLVGRVTQQIQIQQQLAEYYICGSLEMVKDVRKFLVEGGVPIKHIHFEIF